MAGDDNVIENDVVVIGSTLEKGFTKKLQAKLDAATSGVAGKVNLVADATGFKASASKVLAAYAAAHDAPTFKVRLVADATGFAASARLALAKVKSPTFKVKVVADDTGATTGIKKAGAAAGAAGAAAVKQTGTQAKRQTTAIFKEIEGSSLKLADTINKQINKALNDAYVLKNDRVPNTAAAKARALKEAGGAAPSAAGTPLRLIGAAAQRIASRKDAEDLQSAQNYVLGLRERYIEQQLKVIRNGSDQVQRAEKDAVDEQLKVNAGGLVKRFQLLQNGLNATKKYYDDQETAARVAAQKAITENTKQQRADQGFAEFNERIRKTLADNELGRAEDEIKIREDTNARVNAIGKSGLGLKVALLGAEEKLDRESAASATRAAKEIEQAAARRKAAYKKSTSGQQLIDFGGKGIRPLNLLYASVAALTPALFAMGASAVQASTSVAALGAAGIGAALGIGGIVIAFKGLTDLLALRKSVKAEQDQSAANAVSNAHDELVARNNLIDAQKSELKAEKDLHDARKEAARDLVDLRQKVADLQNQQKEDTVSLAEAEANRDKVYRNYFATALDRARADQDVNNAKQKQSDTNLDLKQGKTDLADSVKKGVEKSDKVTNAKDALRQARERAAEVKAAPATGSKSTSPAAQLQAQLAKASPALRDLYNYLDKNSDKFTKLGNQIQQAFLPGFTTFLREVNSKPKGGGKTTLQFFTDESAQIGGVVGKYVAAAGAMTKLPWFRKDFGTIQKNNLKALDILGGAALKLVEPIIKIFAAASPLLVRFSKGIDKFATWFDKVIDKADKDGSLAKWFKDAGDQASKWFDIGKNVLTLVTNLFKTSLPAGGSLVDKFDKFTMTLAEWSSSPKGQQQIARFFDFFKNLPYGDIFKFITQAVGMFAAVQAFKYSTSGPLALLFTGFAALASQHPGEVAKAMAGVNTAVVDLLKFMNNNPKTTAALLSILAVKKVAKNYGLDIKIPGITSLPTKIKDILTSKFKVLDKIFGGGANAATMTVHAGVVNVYGAKGVGATPAGAAATGAKGGALLLGGGLTVAAVVAAVFGTVGYKQGKAGDGFFQGVKDAINNPNWTNVIKALRLFSPIGDAAYLVGAANKPSGDQAKSFKAAQVDAVINGQQYAKEHPDDRGAVLKKSSVAKYIKERTRAVDAEVKQTKATKGTAAATKQQNAENVTSADTLSTLLVYYGYSKDKADAYAQSVFHVWSETDKAKEHSDAAKDSVHTLAGTIKDAAKQASIAADDMHSLNARTGEVAETSKAVFGKHTIEIATVGYKDTYKQLSDLYNIQHVLYDPTYSNSAAGADTKSSQNQYLDPLTGLPKKYMKADGGHIIGPGTATSDSIMARLSNGEYVMPTDVVQHYGLGTMEAMRKKAYPQYAEGGQVWPVKVNVKDIAVPDVSTYVPSGAGGQVAGDQNVAAIVEAVGRQMGATDKQLIAAMETGLVESGLHNLNYGDRDSLGVFQQRPSQGWGSPKQIMNVAYAARKFYEKAMRVDRGVYTSGQLAQAVQVSQFPDRYDKRYADAVANINAVAPFLAGYAGGANGNNLTTVPYTGKIAKGLGKVNNVSAAIYSAIVDAEQAYPSARVTSTYRPGAITVSGNSSYHARNPARAADFSPPSMDLFNYFAGRYGPNAREIIYSPAGEHQIKDGKPHYYSGAVRKQHFDHVHLALAGGGPVQVPTRKYDTGGTLPPGYTLAFNGTGKNETIRTNQQEQALGGPVRLHRADIALLASHIAGAASPQVVMDGRKVAEITNSYTYLPAGV